MDKVKNLLNKDPHVLSFWESPSKLGIKGLVQLSYHFNCIDIDHCHKSAFIKLKEYFKKRYQIILDQSGSDTTRLCFLSYDSNLKIKSDYQPFDVYKADVIEIKRETKNDLEKIIHKNKRDILYNSDKKNSPKERDILKTIIKFLEKRQVSITESYDEWLKVALAISNSFTYDLGEKDFLRLSALDTEKYNEIQCKNFLKEIYYQKSKEITFGTIVHFASKHGYSIKHKRKVGSEVGNILKE